MQREAGLYAAPWEPAFRKIVTPFEEFIHAETSSGILLMVCTATALVLANSPMAPVYEHLLHTPIAVTIGGWTLQHTLHHWINDGLMALFFFLVGLEIKREVLVGELSDPRQAALPIVAAIGGMVVPALFYVAVNFGEPGIGGWGVPMATDIAFAVGVMVLLGNRIPKTLLVFLTALAIVDDLGAVMVIALFYTEQLFFGPLAVAVALFALLLVLNRLGFRRPFPYAIVGTLMWVAMMESGVHATVAGVLTAWAIPARAKFDPEGFSECVRHLMDRYDSKSTGETSLMRDIERRGIVQTLESGVHMVETPLQRFEHRMHMPVAFFILPLFALANAGVPIPFSNLGAALTEPVALGVMVGLVAGKLVGIAGFSLLAIRLGIGQLPAGTTAAQIVGTAFLAGIGFTMSIFIAELGFRAQPELLVTAKIGILAASLTAGIVGYTWLRLVSPPSKG